MRAMVTGASSGIGRAIASELADRGWALVLVGRRRDALAETAHAIARPHDGEHELLEADLGAAAGIVAAAARAGDDAAPIDLLVHSAGVGLPPGGYLGNPLAASEAVNRVTVDAITALTHAALPGMLARDRGGVLVVSSIAGFLPGTPAITYSASKAWATAFGEGLHELTRRTGVTSTVVAPGFVRSGFHASAGLGADGIHDIAWSTPERVARAAVRGVLRGRALVVPGALWSAVFAVVRIVPRSWSRAAFAAYLRWTSERSGR